MAFDIRPARRNDTTEFKFHRLSLSADKPITLQIRHLGSANKAYVDAAFTRKMDLAERPGSEQLAHDRDQDLADIAAFCVTEWNVTEDGKPAACTPDKVLAFFKFALENGYDDEIASLRATVKVLANFREPLATGADLGKG